MRCDFLLAAGTLQCFPSKDHFYFESGAMLVKWQGICQNYINFLDSPVVIKYLTNAGIMHEFGVFPVKGNCYLESVA